MREEPTIFAGDYPIDTQLGQRHQRRQKMVDYPREVANYPMEAADYPREVADFPRDRPTVYPVPVIDYPRQPADYPQQPEMVDYPRQPDDQPQLDRSGIPFIKAGTTVQLPYHINPETGAGYELEVEADTPVPVFQAEVDRLFPKTLASLATQLLDKSPNAPLLSEEDFMQVWNSAQAMDAGKTEKQNQIKGGPGFWKAGGDVIKESLRSLGSGAMEMADVGGRGLMALSDLDPNAASRAAVKLINGVITGTGRLVDSAAVVGALAWDKMVGDPYSVYAMGKQAQAAEYLRKTQGYQMVPGSSQEEIDSALQLGNVLDITVLLPAVSALTKGMSKTGQIAAEQTVQQFTEAMAQKSAESIGRRALGQVLETAGGAVEKVGALSGIGDSLAKGLLGKATTAGALAAAYVLPEEGLLGDVGTALGTYGTLRTMQTGGAAMKWAGKILGSDELASKVIQQGLRNAEVQGAERLALKLVKNIPDPVVRMTRKVMDGAMIPAAIGATLSGAQEASDPFSSPLDVAEATVLGGLGGATVGGFISGAVGLAGEVSGKAREQSFVREIMTDIATRPEQRSFVIGNQDVLIPDDIQNRLKVLGSDAMTTRQKASLFGILDSAEHAGIDVAFINDGTQLPDALGGSGANMGKGVKFVNDAGRTTLFVNADQITHTGAIHEVMHAYISDQVASDFVRNLTKERGGEVGAFQELSSFAQRYYDTQVQTNPEAAAQIKASIDQMNNPQIPLQDRLVAATNLAHEYMAEGISQSLADAKPESLQDFRGSAISGLADRAFQGALEKINTSFGMSSVGATQDPISGHFFKDGKIISNQPLADITKKVRTAINTRTQVPASGEPAGRPFTPPRDAPVVGETMPSGGRVVSVEPRATYEDTHANGALTTDAEKTVYHKAVWNQAAQTMGAAQADAVLIQQGVYPGNIKEGTPIIYADKLTPQLVSGLFQVQTHHGRPLIAPENREPVARFAQALNDGNLVTVTHSVNVGKSTGKDRAYTVSIAQVGFPMSFSMSSGKKGSGPKMEFFNLSLVNDMVNLNRTYSPAIDAALKDLKVTSLDDTIPYVKTYIDNLSSTGSVPSARALAAVAPEGVKTKSLEFMRDMLSMSSGIEPRKKRGEVRINEPFMSPEQFRKFSNPEVEAVTPTGERFKTKLSRERAVVQSIRLDGVTDVQLYQPNGTPVQVNVNKPQLVNKVRANFSPASSNREALPNGEAITDTTTGERIIVVPKGKAKLFDSQGKLVGVFEDEDAAVLKSNQDKLKQQVRFSPRRTSAEKRAADLAAEERKFGVPSTTPNLATFESEAITKARNEIVREGTPTLAGKVADPEFANRLLASQAVVEQAQKEDALGRRVDMVARKRREIQQRQAEIQAAAADKEKSGKLGPVEFGTKAFREIFELKSLEDIMLPGSPTKLPPELKVTPDQLRQVFRNLDVEEFPAPQETPAPVYDFISQKTPRTEITHRTELGKIQTESAKAARVGDMKIDQMLKAMSDKREAMFDAELARVRNKFDTMELQGKAEEARQAGIDPEIVRLRQEHFANISQQIAQATEPAPLNSGPAEPPVQTVLPGIATAADDPRIPQSFAIQQVRGKFKIWSIGRQAVQAVTDTYQDALKKAQAMQLKRRKKQNA